MVKRLRSFEVARLLKNYYDSHRSESQRLILIQEFQPIIKLIATRYPDSSWLADLVQEGNIGLLNAISKFPESGDGSRFLGYSIKAIKNAMIDFNDAKIQKFVPQPEQPSIDLDVATIPKKKPMFVYTSTLSSNPNETINYSAISSASHRFCTWSSWSVGIICREDNQEFKRIGLTERDIQIWNLYVQGYKVLEIGQIIQLSSSYTSKLLGKIKSKISRVYK